MAILLKYREVVTRGPSREPAATALETAARARTLFTIGRRPVRARDPSGVLPRQETVRLRSALADLGIAVGGVIVNAAGAGDCPRAGARTTARPMSSPRCGGRSGSRASYAIIEAPASMPPPHGARALSAWASTWSGSTDGVCANAVYVYCLVAAARRPARVRPLPACLAALVPIVTSAGDGLFLVSSEVPLSVYGPPALGRASGRSGMGLRGCRRSRAGGRALRPTPLDHRRPHEDVHDVLHVRKGGRQYPGPPPRHRRGDRSCGGMRGVGRTGQSAPSHSCRPARRSRALDATAVRHGLPDGS